MAFRGWPTEALDFYEGLEADNSKTYWTSHRSVYDGQVLAPMVELLDSLEPEFGTGKIFRPYRDVRFSADKTPYKTAIGATLELGGYIQLSAKGLAAGAGRYRMSPRQLDDYRRAVAGDASGRELVRVVEALAQQKIDVTGHDTLRTVPRGFPRDHPRADLLRHKGLIAWKEWPAGAWLGRPAARTRVVDFLRASRILTGWLDRYVGDEDEVPAAR
jgi:uncharacterized protein (TIGR02453 family)